LIFNLLTYLLGNTEQLNISSIIGWFRMCLLRMWTGLVKIMYQLGTNTASNLIFQYKLLNQWNQSTSVKFETYCVNLELLVFRTVGMKCALSITNLMTVSNLSLQKNSDYINTELS